MIIERVGLAKKRPVNPGQVNRNDHLVEMEADWRYKGMTRCRNAKRSSGKILNACWIKKENPEFSQK